MFTLVLSPKRRPIMGFRFKKKKSFLWPCDSIRQHISLSLSRPQLLKSPQSPNTQCECLLKQCKKFKQKLLSWKFHHTSAFVQFFFFFFSWCTAAQLHRVLVEITKHYQKGKPKSAGLVIFMPSPHIDQVTSKGQCISNAAWPAF